ncbi:serine hydrolase domain-containing protein [Hymenobacter cheonanensis]|uniref:serine hydrolase domain-containing protein n=1 Tax=Hymenobacter sp. CA2-7 TaxID=3063993 RepID=UPI002712B6C8|nr:serine hydrolase [Hymenobacter sp. CA2-7]MDO7884623.1 serine hydrolase [Hymenobacter sp. CA2-7]
MLRYPRFRPVVFFGLLLLSWLAGVPAVFAQLLPPRLAPGVVVLRNADQLLPLRRLDTLRLATVKLRAHADVVDFCWPLPQEVAAYVPGMFFVGPQPADFAALRKQNLLLLALPDGSATDRAALRRLLALRKQTIALVFDSTTLAALPELRQATAVVLAPGHSYQAVSQAVQVLFGGLGAAALPGPATAHAGFGPGLATEGGLRLSYGSPAEAGLRASLPELVDSLVKRALEAGAFPGGQVIVARHGVVALRRSYGVQQMGPGAPAVPRPVLNNTLYDFASLTKVTAALPALMLLQDRGLLGPDYTLGSLFDFLQGTDKQNIRLRDVLTHQARLRAFIPFWQDYVYPNGLLRPQFLRPDSTRRSPLPVAAGIWASRLLPGRLYAGIAASALNAKPGYVYSDLSFMLYPYYVQKATGQPFDQFITEQLYRPLGASTLGFNPLRRFPLGRIAPTEYDSLFRHQLVHGTVHDEGAALLGGVSGHAGLFGSANDLAKLVQLYLWQGRYGGQQLIKAETIAEYTACQFCPDNRRALGFDKPDPKNPALNAARSASPRSYGHTGFTGTYFWVEPDLDLFVILLTNRVNPTRNNGKLGELGVRSALLQLAIESARP